VQTSRTSWSGNFSPAAVTIELEPGGANSAARPPALMTVYADGGYEFTTAGSRVFGRGEFGEGAVLDWMKAAGIDVTAADIREKASRIAAEVRIAARSGRAAMIRSSGGGFSSSSSSGGNPTDVFQNRSSSESGYSYSPAAALIGMLVFWIAVWIWGVWYLVSRGGRGRRAAAAVAFQAAPT